MGSNPGGGHTHRMGRRPQCQPTSKNPWMEVREAGVKCDHQNSQSSEACMLGTIYNSKSQLQLFHQNTLKSTIPDETKVMPL